MYIYIYMCLLIFVSLGCRAPAPKTIGVGGLPTPAQESWGRHPPNSGVWGAGAPRPRGERKSILNTGRSSRLQEVSGMLERRVHRS